MVFKCPTLGSRQGIKCPYPQDVDVHMAQMSHGRGKHSPPNTHFELLVWPKYFHNQNFLFTFKQSTNFWSPFLSHNIKIHAFLLHQEFKTTFPNPPSPPPQNGIKFYPQIINQRHQISTIQDTSTSLITFLGVGVVFWCLCLINT